jgi:serine phosphatase RsbU (regulator of sigma subunit)
MQTARIQAGDTVTIVSDGIIEQFGMVQKAGQISREQFGITGVQNVLAGAKSDIVASLLAAVMQHGGTENLSDDATAVVVSWR